MTAMPGRVQRSGRSAAGDDTGYGAPISLHDQLARSCRATRPRRRASVSFARSPAVYGPASTSAWTSSLRELAPVGDRVEPLLPQRVVEVARASSPRSAVALRLGELLRRALVLGDLLELRQHAELIERAAEVHRRARHADEPHAAGGVDVDLVGGARDEVVAAGARHHVREDLLAGLAARARISSRSSWSVAQPAVGAVEHHDQRLRRRIARDRAQPHDERRQLARADRARQLDALDVIGVPEHATADRARRRAHDSVPPSGWFVAEVVAQRRCRAR